MERSGSTVDRHALHSNEPLDNFEELEGIAIKDLRVFIFMKPNSLKLDPYIMHVIHYLQRFEIQSYVTEEVMEKLREEVQEGTSCGDEANSEQSDVPEVDLDKVEIFSDANQSKINRLITLGGDGTVVQAIKLFYKDKCPIMITFSKESVGYLCCFENENYEKVLFNSLINLAPDKEEFGVDEKAEIDIGYEKAYIESRERVVLKIIFDDLNKSVKSSFSPKKTVRKPKFGSLYSLNQITIDRGAFNYLTNIE